MRSDEEQQMIDQMDEQNGYQAAINELRKMLNGGGGGSNNDSDPDDKQQPELNDEDKKRAREQQNGDDGQKDKEDKQGEDKQGKGGKGSEQDDDKDGEQHGQEVDKNGNPKQKPQLNPDDAKKAEAAKKAKKGDKNKDSDDKGGNKAGEGDSDIDLSTLVKENARWAKETCEKFKNRISGPLKPFVDMCNQAAACKRPDVIINAEKGNMSWVDALKTDAMRVIAQKIDERVEREKTYTRPHRRGEAMDFDSDNNVLVQGERDKLDKFGFDMALYVDISGSMSGHLDDVFKTAYSICDILKKESGKMDFVDENQITTKVYVFDTKMKEIKYGSKCAAGGCTYAFDDLLDDIQKRGNNAYLNFVITDGEFQGYSDDRCAKIIKGFEGMFALVTNQGKGSFNTLYDTVKRVAGENKLLVYYTSAKFEAK